MPNLIEINMDMPAVDGEVLRRFDAGLLLQRSGRTVTREEVEETDAPAPTDGWTPIPHIELIETIEKAVRGTMFAVGASAHSLSHGGAHYFGLLEVRGRSCGDARSWVVGLRNTYDKTFPECVRAGAQVFVCGNMGAEGALGRGERQSPCLGRELPLLVERAIGKVMNKRHQESVWF